MRNHLFLAYFFLLVFSTAEVHAAIVVAAEDSLPVEKAKADLICDGKDDQVELAASLAKATFQKPVRAVVKASKLIGPT